MKTKKIIILFALVALCINLNARYYNPTLGRFISADTVIPGGGADLQGLNRYSYCVNNPIIYIDPTGHAGEQALPLITKTVEQAATYSLDDIAAYTNILLNTNTATFNASKTFLRTGATIASLGLTFLSLYSTVVDDDTISIDNKSPSLFNLVAYADNEVDYVPADRLSCHELSEKVTEMRTRLVKNAYKNLGFNPNFINYIPYHSDKEGKKILHGGSVNLMSEQISIDAGAFNYDYLKKQGLSGFLEIIAHERGHIELFNEYKEVGVTDFFIRNSEVLANFRGAEMLTGQPSHNLFMTALKMDLDNGDNK